MLVVFDLDDTLADPAKRLHHIRKGIPDFDAFFKARAVDRPVFPVISMLRAFVNTGASVEIWTATPERYRANVEDWLVYIAGIDPQHLTRMRDDDTLSALDLKTRWVTEQRPDIAFEDHVDIIRMMRSRGVFVFAVGENTY